jgi:hypothetical protein
MPANNMTLSRVATNAASRSELADIPDLLGLHFQASRRMEEVLEQIQELRSAGKLAEARALQMHADGMSRGIRAIEAEVRLATRKSK